MNAEFTIDELVELRCDLTYAAQKVSNLVIAQLSNRHRAKHTEHYSAEDMASAKRDLELARFQLRAITDKMLPALQGLLQEKASV